MASETDKPPTSAHVLTTYHCICTHLLLASTTPLPSLPTRRTPDHALILRLPAASSRAEDLSTYAAMLGTVADQTPVVIRGEEGFEKRYLTKCGRCGVVVGYWLDWGMFQEDAEGKKGRREDVLYVLPGGWSSTEEMGEGRDLGKTLDLGR